jgi:4-hydroxybenzoate polyprenyltransferase
MVKALRPHQWAKNLLIFLPVVAGHQFDPAILLQVLLAFVAFCLAASSAYIVNDLLDLPADRAHPRKRRRPFAACDIGARLGLVMSATLAALALGVALLLPLRFGIILVGYVFLTLAYSFYLKRRMLIDVIVLGGLYTIRVFAGLAASEQMTSQWLLMFSLFLFLSLAIVKRSAELVAWQAAGATAPSDRGYRTSDLPVLFGLAAAAGFGSILVIALYLSSPEVRVLYSHPLRMWLVFPLLLYWIGRVLLKTSRNEMHDDPIVFAIRDRVSWMTGALTAIVIVAAI